MKRKDKMSQSAIKIAIQGWPGANHDIAARAYFGEAALELVPCLSFPELFDKMNQDEEMLGMVAIENTLVGSLLANYTLLKDSGFTVLGEHKLRIKHQLMALPGQTLADIYEVHSHPMALAQCEQFFKNYPHIRLVESEDTALSAKRIAENRTPGIAVIASTLADQINCLEMLAPVIETNKHNYPRSVVVGRADDQQKQKSPSEGRLTKPSLIFSQPHGEGSIFE